MNDYDRDKLTQDGRNVLEAPDGEPEDQLAVADELSAPPRPDARAAERFVEPGPQPAGATEPVEIPRRPAAPSDPAHGRAAREPAVFGKSVVREYFESMVVTFIMALFGMTFITQAVKVPTGSMLNTILIEDHLMVNKFVFGPHASWLGSLLPYREIRRGDIIVFKYPKDPETNYVKRVIGLPGDTVEVHGTSVYINGAVLPENKVLAVNPQNRGDLEPLGEGQQVEGANYTVYYDEIRDLEESGAHGFSTLTIDGQSKFAVRAPYQIPEGGYFVMGDNRDDSEDSRVWGTVPRENVIGRAMFVYWSMNQAERAEEGPSNFLVDFVKHTRWGRTGTLIK
jgi:signal peptidase I